MERKISDELLKWKNDAYKRPMLLYGISGCGTVSRWNKEHDEGRLGVDNRGRKPQEIDDAEI